MGQRRGEMGQRRGEMSRGKRRRAWRRAEPNTRGRAQGWGAKPKDRGQSPRTEGKTQRQRAYPNGGGQNPMARRRVGPNGGRGWSPTTKGR